MLWYDFGMKTFPFYGLVAEHAEGVARSSGAVMFGVLICLYFLPTSVSASSVTGVSPTIEDSTGLVSGLVSEYGSNPSVNGYRVYDDRYPLGDVICEGSMGYNLSDVDGFYLMEYGWYCGATTTPDGFYHVELALSGSPYSPDWNGDILYWGAERASSFWFPLPVVSGTSTMSLIIISPSNLEVVSSTSVEVIVQYEGLQAFGEMSLRYYDDFLLDTGVATTSVATSGFAYFDLSLEPYHTYYLEAYVFLAPLVDGYFSDTIRVDVLGASSLASTTAYQDWYNEINGLVCSVSNISGCFKKALVWAFVPSPSVVMDFVSVKNEILHKKPWGYMTLMYEYIEDLSLTSSSSASDIVLPSTSFDGGVHTTPDIVLWSWTWVDDMPSVFATLSLWLRRLLWLGFGLWLYKFAVSRRL